MVVVLLSAVLGVDAKGPLAAKTEKLYRKPASGSKLRDVGAAAQAVPAAGEKGDECVLKSEITVNDATDKNDYMPKSTVEAEYVLKGADVFTQGDVEAAVAALAAAKDEDIAANGMSNDEAAAKEAGVHGRRRDVG